MKTNLKRIGAWALCFMLLLSCGLFILRRTAAITEIRLVIQLSSAFYTIFCHIISYLLLFLFVNSSAVSGSFSEKLGIKGFGILPKSERCKTTEQDSCCFSRVFATMYRRWGRTNYRF